MKEYRIQARLVLTGLGLTNVWVEEKNRLDRLDDREATEGSQVRSAQPDFTQVLRAIQINRAVPLPQPEVKSKRKRKRKKRTNDVIVTAPENEIVDVSLNSDDTESED